MSLGRRIAAWIAAAMVAGAVVLLPSPAFAESSTLPVGDYPRPVAVSPDGSRGYVAIAVPGGPGRLVEFDTATDEVLRETAIQNEPLSLVLSPDGARAYVAGEVSGLIDVIDLASLTTVATWTVPPLVPGGDNGVAQFLAVGPDGDVFASVRNQARVVQLDPATGVVDVGFDSGPLPAGVAVGGGYLYVAVSVGQTVTRFDLVTQATVSIDVPTTPATYFLALSPDGSQLWVSGYTSTIVARVDTATFTTAFTVDLGVRVAGDVVTADGTRVYVPLDDLSANAVAVLDSADGSELGRVAVGADPRFIALVPGTDWAWVSNVLGASLSLIGPPIPQAPTDVAIVEGGSASFTASARATVDGFQWQRSDDGVTWVDVPGATDATLTFVATLADDGARFRFVASSELFGSAESESALLSVSATPVPPVPPVPPAPPGPPAPCPGAQGCPLPATGLDVAPVAAGAVGAMVLAGGLLIAATRSRSMRSHVRR